MVHPLFSDKVGTLFIYLKKNLDANFALKFFLKKFFPQLALFGGFQFNFNFCYD